MDGSMAYFRGTAWAYFTWIDFRLPRPASYSLSILVGHFSRRGRRRCTSPGPHTGMLHHLDFKISLFPEMLCTSERVRSSMLRCRPTRPVSVRGFTWNSHSWEGLVQLGHHAADGGGLLHEIDIEAGIGQIESGLHSANPSATTMTEPSRCSAIFFPAFPYLTLALFIKEPHPWARQPARPILLDAAGRIWFIFKPRTSRPSPGSTRSWDRE